MTILHDASSGNGIGQEFPLPAKITESTIMQPVDIQGRYAQTIQTHNAVSILTTANSQGSYIDMNGFDKVAITAKNDISANFKVEIIWSHDGVTQHHFDTVFTGTSAYGGGIVEIKSRYAKISVTNSDAGTRIISTWVYLKA